MKVRVVFGLLVLGLLGGKLGADCVTRCIEASGSYHKRAGILSPSFCIAYEPFKALILKGDNGQQGAEVVADGEWYTEYTNCDTCSSNCTNMVIFNSYEGSAEGCSDSLYLQGRGYCDGC